MTIKLLAAHRAKSCSPSLGENPLWTLWVALPWGKGDKAWLSLNSSQFGRWVAICPAPRPGCFRSDLLPSVLLSVLLDVTGPFCVGRCLSLGRITALGGLGSSWPCWVTQQSCWTRPVSRLQCPTKHSWDDAEPKGTLDCFPLRLKKPQQ